MLVSKQKGRNMETEESQVSRGELLSRAESKQTQNLKSEET